MKSRIYISAMALVILGASFETFAESSRCEFDRDTSSFSGSPQEQARCLLSPVFPFGHLSDEILQDLPDELGSLVGEQISIDVESFRAYLALVRMHEQTFGGSLDKPLSSNSRGEEATYFVIHDTSFEMDKPFPLDLQASHHINRLDRYADKGKGAHVFVNRTGQILVNKPFSVPSGATKFEKINITRAVSRGLFLHVELVQPRNREPGRYFYISPDPGFSELQYDRLAMLYVAASVRKGEWMIPAYHRLIDDGMDSHDDPQGFDLDYWSVWVGYIVDEIAFREL